MKRNDILLIAGIFLAALLVFGAIRLSGTKGGDIVEIEADGTAIKTLPLNTDTSYTIKTKSGINILEIKNGSANITEADCPDKLCVHQKAISRQGETLVCLPHKVIVSIRSSKKATLDGVAQ
ncbi:NusG domain II-containing protein [bacterium D16-51]|nr:NusG domain II-containing protein [bacterium D16-59]RKI58324.1 NusG domain II-containing protein [bacterium D16-51]